VSVGARATAGGVHEGTPTSGPWREVPGWRGTGSNLHASCPARENGRYPPVSRWIACTCSSATHPLARGPRADRVRHFARTLSHRLSQVKAGGKPDFWWGPAPARLNEDHACGIVRRKRGAGTEIGAAAYAIGLRSVRQREPQVGFEPTTARLRIECSTPELLWPINTAGAHAGAPPNQCPGADSNRDAFRHYPLKIACLPVSPPGRAAQQDSRRSGEGQPC
jgi:hypothetical protein